jgi:hypothetical protein
MGGKNRIVVDYGDYEGLILLGAFDTESGVEVPYEELEKLEGFKLAKKYDGIEDYSTLKSLIKDNEEGFVVRFSNGHRMKIKGEEYVRLHKIMTNLSTTAVWEVLSSGGEIEDILVNVPDEFYKKIKSYVNSLHEEFNSVRKEVEDLYYTYYHSEDHLSHSRKDFALWTLEKPKHLQPILFKMFDGKEYFSYIWKIIKPEFKKL